MSRIHASALALALAGCTPPGAAQLDSHPMNTSGPGTSTTEPGTSTDDTSSSSTTADASSGSDTGSAGSTASTSASETTTSTSTSSSSTSTGEPDSSTTAPATCGDGELDPGEECDDGNDVSGDACDACVRPRLAFATSQLFSPELIAGLTGADNICRQLALQAGHPRWTTFVAWLSDSKTDARDRVPPAPGRYVRADGVTVVEDFEQLLSGALQAAINVDELGEPAPGDVWTGTRPDGTAVPGSKHCDDWTTSNLADFEGYLGSCDATDASWTLIPDPNVNPNTCIIETHLYCFEGA